MSSVPSSAIVIDEDQTLQVLIASYLTKMGVARVVPVADGNTALAVAAAMGPELIVLDWRHKKKPGLEIYQALRRNERTQHIPIILISGFISPKDVEIARADELLNFLVKPFTEEILFKVTQQLHQAHVVRFKREQGRAEDYVMADDELDDPSAAIGVMATMRVRVPTRVAVIDEDELMIKFVEKCLRRIGVATIDGFRDSEAAWQALIKQPYDLVVMDWKLRPLSAIALLNRIKVRPETAGLPLVVMSGLVKNKDFRILAESEQTVFLEKPFRGKVFCDAVAALLGESMTHKSMLSRIEGELGAPDVKDKDIVDTVSRMTQQAKGSAKVAVSAARYLIKRGRFAAAENVLLVALRAAPESIAVITELGKVYHRTNRPAEAMKALSRATDFSPQNLERLCLMGEVGLTLKNSEKAREYFGKVLAVDDQHPVAKAGVTVSTNFSEHIKSDQTPLSLNFASTLNIIGITMIRNGKFQKGIEQYMAAQAFLQDAPSLSRIKFNLGIAYLRMDMINVAKKWLKEAVALDPTFTKAGDWLDRADDKVPRVLVDVEEEEEAINFLTYPGRSKRA